MKKNLSKVLCVALSLTVVLGCAGCSSKETEQKKDTSSEVVAVFEGENILQKDIQDMLDFMSAAYSVDEDSDNWDAMKYSTVQAYINDRICAEKAKEFNIEVKQEELQKEIDYAVAQYGGEESYEEFLSSMNTSKDFVENQIKSQLIYNKLFDKVTKDVKVTDKEVSTYYDEHPDEFVTEETRDVYGIAFATEKEAKAALEDLTKNNANFRAMANEKSLDNQNGDGFLGTVKKGDLVDEFNTEVFSLKSNEYCDKVLSLDATLEDGTITKYYYVIKVTKIVPAKTLSFKEAKEDLKNTLLEEAKQEKYNTEFENWKKECKYEIKINNVSTETTKKDDEKKTNK